MTFSLSRWFRPIKPSCPLCGQAVYSTRRSRPVPVRNPEARALFDWLCADCSESIPWITTPVCRICGRPEHCPDCPRRPERHFRFARCAVRYDDAMKNLLALYKYRGSERLEPIMAAMLACAFESIAGELVMDSHINDRPVFHAVTSVPLAQERLIDRGFNQAERMAETLAAWYNLPYHPLLLRVRHTEKQSLKNRQSRLADMKGNFAAIDRIENLIGKPKGNHATRILLVDDIYTTGSTVNECAFALRSALSANSTQTSLEIYGALWARS